MIVFLYGEDKFRLNEKLKQLKEEFFKKNPSNATSSVFDFGEGNFYNEFKIAMKSRGLFSQNYLIIAKNLLSQENAGLREDFVNFFTDNLDNANSPENIIIFLENEKPKKNDKIFKWLIRNSKSEEFSKLSNVQLRNWIEKRFLSLGAKVDSKIIDSLVSSKNGDLFAIDGEISKIVNFIGKDDFNEDLSDQVAKFLSSNVEANIFQTIEFIASGNKQKALELLHQQLAQGSDPFYILSMYVYQIRNLLKIADFYFQGNTNYTEVSKIIRVHPFVVQKGMQQLRSLDFAKLKNIYQELEKIDEKAKKGKMSVEVGMDLLIAGM